MFRLWAKFKKCMFRPPAISRASLAAIVTWWLLSGTAIAEIFIEQAFPPCVQRGKTVRVKFTGTELDGAFALWSSTKAVQAKLVAADREHATFDVETSPGARVGMYGFRVATHSGLSNLHLFVIDDLPTLDELETVRVDTTNDRFTDAQPVAQPAVVVGTSTESDVDHYAIEVEAGQQMSFEVVASRLGKAFDPVIRIMDDRGRVVRMYDNDPGLFFDFRFQHTFKSAGRYVLELHDSRYHGSPHWTYMLRLGRFPASRVAVPSTIPGNSKQLVSFPGFSGDPREVEYGHAGRVDRFYFGLRGAEDNAPVWVPMQVSPWKNLVETEPNDAAGSSVAADVPTNLHGSFHSPDDQDWFQFELKKETVLEFRSETRALGSPADIELAIFSDTGERLASSDDSDFDDAQLSFTTPADGMFYLQVTELVRKSGPPYTYRIEVAGRRPDFVISSELARLTIPHGTRQPLPLSVKRTDYDEEIELSLLGAPKGMTLESSTLPAGADALTTAIVVDQSVPLGLHSVQVVAMSVAGAPSVAAVASTAPLVDRLPDERGPHGEAFELREDQRRLPPTTADRIAVLVVPEATWDFEIVEDEVVVPRYVQSSFTIHTTRDADYHEAVTFVARGGPLEQDRLRMPSITSMIPKATPDDLEIVAVLKSGVDTKLERHRVAVTGSARDGERTVHLTRTFELETKAAYRPSPETPEIELKPGGTRIVRIAVNRLPQMQVPIKLTFTAPEGIQVPATVVVPSEQKSGECELTVAEDIKPGRYSVAVSGDAVIGKFLERVEGDQLTVVVKE
ncbi:MAG: hypothetical protein ABGZ35_27470 [Planctomycetaceae bacterium]